MAHALARPRNHNTGFGPTKRGYAREEMRAAAGRAVGLVFAALACVSEGHFCRAKDKLDEADRQASAAYHWLGRTRIGKKPIATGGFSGETIIPVRECLRYLFSAFGCVGRGDFEWAKVYFETAERHARDLRV